MEIVLIGFHFLLFGSLTIITILVNTYEDAVIWNLWATSIKLSELAIVKRKKYFNIMTWLCISCGLLSYALGFASQKLSKQELEKEEIDVKEQGKPLKSDQSNTLLNQNNSNVWRNHLPDSKILTLRALNTVNNYSPL